MRGSGVKYASFDGFTYKPRGYLGELLGIFRGEEKYEIRVVTNFSRMKILRNNLLGRCE